MEFPAVTDQQLEQITCSACYAQGRNQCSDEQKKVNSFDEQRIVEQRPSLA